MTKEEMFRLQGMDPTIFNAVIPDTHLGQQLGNAMSVNVIERILQRSLAAANIYKMGTDRWETGKGLERLQSTIGKKLHRDVCKSTHFVLPNERIHRKIALAPKSRFRSLIVDSGA